MKPDEDPQCPWLLERIQELRAALAAEPEAARQRHWRDQLRRLDDRARRLGCFDPRVAPALRDSCTR